MPGREGYPGYIPLGTQWDSMDSPGLGTLPPPGYTAGMPAASISTTANDGCRPRAENGALGSTAQMALGQTDFLANSRWFLNRAPIRQDYGEFISQ